MTIRTVAVATLVAITSLATSSLADDLPKPDKEGYISLFDGKTLKGWHKNPKRIGHGTGGQWYVEAGAIVGEQDPPGSGNGGILLTDHKFGNFELLIDMNHDWGPCSGLFLRSNDRGQCLQMMVDYHNGGNIGHIYGEGTGGFNSRAFNIDGKLENGKLASIVSSAHKAAEQHGCLFTCTPEQWIKAWKIGDWNTIKVTCVGKYPLVTTWINGVKICEFDAASYKGRGYDKEGVYKTLGDQGSIAVQVHGGGGWPKGAKVRWKNIRIKPL
jgi:hypothetical protein